MIKCKACGFDSPDEASWCDFCKEPFRKKPQNPDPPPKVESAPAPPPQPIPEPSIPVPLLIKKPGQEPALNTFAIERALASESTGKMAQVPMSIRALALLFLISSVLSLLFLAAYMMKQKKKNASPKSAPTYPASAAPGAPVGAENPPPPSTPPGQDNGALQNIPVPQQTKTPSSGD